MPLFAGFGMVLLLWYYVDVLIIFLSDMHLSEFLINVIFRASGKVLQLVHLICKICRFLWQNLGFQSKVNPLCRKEVDNLQQQKKKKRTKKKKTLGRVGEI